MHYLLRSILMYFFCFAICHPNVAQNSDSSQLVEDPNKMEESVDSVNTWQQDQNKINKKIPTLSLKDLTEQSSFVRSTLLSHKGISITELGPIYYLKEEYRNNSLPLLSNENWTKIESDDQFYFNSTEPVWYRINYQVDSSLIQVPLEMVISATGILEIYKDNKKIFQQGRFSKSGLFQFPKYANSRQLSFLFNKNDLQHSYFLIKYQSFSLFNMEYTTPFSQSVSQSFDITIHNADNIDEIIQIQHNTLVHYGIFFSATFLIFLLTLIIYFGNKQNKSWLYLSMLSFFSSMVCFSNLFIKGTIGMELGKISYLTLMNSIAHPLSILFLLIVLRSLINNRNVYFKIWHYILLAGTVIVTELIIRTYSYNPIIDNINTIATMLMLLEIVRLISLAILHKIKGIWIIGVGGLLFVFGILLEQYYLFSSLEMPRFQRTLMRFTYYLSMPVGISVFLAYKASYNSKMVKKQRDELDIKVQQRTEELEKEKEKSDSLLLNILPHSVASELKENGKSKAKEFSNVTILFTDFVNFTKAGERMKPLELVEELDTCFRAFDELILKHDLEKIKTVGDSYIAVSGLPVENSDHAEKVMNASIDIRDFMNERNQKLGNKTFEIRIGVHTGPVVAGIVGIKKFAYDIWGDTVNTAARMEQYSKAGKINISHSTYERIKDKFECQLREIQTVKNKGEMRMYFVTQTNQKY